MDVDEDAPVVPAHGDMDAGPRGDGYFRDGLAVLADDGFGQREDVVCGGHAPEVERGRVVSQRLLRLQI